MVIFTERHSELQEILNVVMEYGSNFYVRFSKEKNQVLLVNGNDWIIGE